MFTGGNTMNIAVMTDSNSGITQEKAKELGCKALCFEGNIDFYGKSGFT